MTRKKLKDIITDHICFDEEESKLNSLIEDIMSELIAELNPPVTPRTADGVDVKDGDTVWLVRRLNKTEYSIASGFVDIMAGDNRILFIQPDSYTRKVDERNPIFSSFHAACKHIATLLGVETAADLMTLNPNHSEFDQRSSDAAVWAKAFCDYFPGHDEGTMIGWFANAMVAAMDHSKKQIELGRQIGAECAKSSAETEPMVPLKAIDIPPISSGELAYEVCKAFTKHCQKLSADGDDIGIVGNEVVINGFTSTIMGAVVNTLDAAIRSQIADREKTRKDDGKWVGYDMRKEAGFIWGGVYGWTARLDEVVPFTSKQAAEKEIFETYHVIPLSKAREIEAKRLNKQTKGA